MTLGRAPDSPLLGAIPAGDDTARWAVWGVVARIVLTDPVARDEAVAIARAELDAVDVACSRFREDSELRAVGRSGGRPVTVSPLLAELVAASLRAARATGGAVDPTIGAALPEIGPDYDLADGAGRVFPAPDYRKVRLRGRELTVPDGMRLDLDATAKAVAADRIAARIARRLGLGALVSLGGDIATAGPAPEPGWQVLVQDRPGDPSGTIRLPAGGALATSSTAGRTWGRHGEVLHHIIDPRTGRPAAAIWRTVSVAAGSCLRANTLSTAAIVRGRGAYDLLRDVPSRLVTPTFEVIRLGGWPA